jgi:hypothetical protein
MAVATLAAIGLGSVGAVIGVAQGRLWFWRSVQIIPLGWEPDTWRQAYETAGAAMGFMAVWLLLGLLFLIASIWKHIALAGKPVYILPSRSMSRIFSTGDSKYIGSQPTVLPP